MSTTESRPDHDSFGALIRDVEATPEGRAELAQGQQWVYEQFYRDGPCPMLWAAYSDQPAPWPMKRLGRSRASTKLSAFLARCWPAAGAMREKTKTPSAELGG